MPEGEQHFDMWPFKGENLSMVVEVRWHYLLTISSVLVLIFLRHWPWFAITYCAALLTLTLALIWWRQTHAENEAKQFRQRLMIHLAQNERRALGELVRPSMRYRLLGLMGLVYEGRAFHSAMGQEYELATRWAQRALRRTKAKERNRLLFNMARWSALSGSLTQAERLFKQVLAINPKFMGAQAHLGALLIQRTATLEEGLERLAQATDDGLLGRDLDVLLQVSEAQRRANDERWQATLSRCWLLGASDAEIERIRTLIP